MESFPPFAGVTTLPPVPKSVSSAPEARYLVSAKSNPPLVPKTYDPKTNLPSLCRSSAGPLQSSIVVGYTIPAPPNDGSKSAGAAVSGAANGGRKPAASTAQSKRERFMARVYWAGVEGPGTPQHTGRPVGGEGLFSRGCCRRTAMLSGSSSLLRRVEPGTGRRNAMPGPRGQSSSDERLIHRSAPGAAGELFPGYSPPPAGTSWACSSRVVHGFFPMSEPILRPGA